MGLEGNGNAKEGVLEGACGLRRIGGEELLRSEDSADGEIGFHSLQDVYDPRNVIRERDVDGFNVRPERKAPIGDDQRVGVPDSAEEGIDCRVEDSAL
jgi:hypothetical protein